MEIGLTDLSAKIWGSHGNPGDDTQACIILGKATPKYSKQRERLETNTQIHLLRVRTMYSKIKWKGMQLTM